LPKDRPRDQIRAPLEALQQKVENSATGHIGEPSRTNSNSFLSDEGEPHPRRSPSPEADEADEVTGPQETDIDDEEGGYFDEEEVTEDTTSGDFGGRSEDLDSVARVGRGEVGEDCEMLGMWDNIDSVRNSEGFGVEPVPISQEERRPMNRTIKRPKMAV